MKTNLLPLFTTLLLGASVSAKAQDFRAVPPTGQPNAAELAYFGGKNPNVPVINGSDSACVRLVTSFLHDLVTSQMEAAHQRMAKGFVAYGPGYNDNLQTNDLLNQWEHDGQLFADQHLLIDTASTTLVANGDNRGTWVYMKVVWSARERVGQGKPVRIAFHQLAQVNNGLIERTYTSYGADQLFYDLGFPLYTGGAERTHK